MENSSLVWFHNPAGHDVDVIRVDGCVLLAHEGSKCDYLVNIAKLVESVFVELKSAHGLGHALVQLEQTHKMLGQHTYQYVT